MALFLGMPGTDDLVTAAQNSKIRIPPCTTLSSFASTVLQSKLFVTNCESPVINNCMLSSFMELNMLIRVHQ